MARPSKIGTTVKLPLSFFTKMAKLPIFVENEIFKEEIKSITRSYSHSWDTDDKIIPVDITICNVDFLKEFKKVAEKELNDKLCKRTVKEINIWLSYLENPDGTEVLSLEYLEQAIIRYVVTSERLFLYQKVDDYHLPYLVTSVAYNPPYRLSGGGMVPAYVEMRLAYAVMGEMCKETVRFEYYDINFEGATVKEILASKGYFLENESLDFEYDASMVQFNKYHNQVGKQFLAIGYADVRSSRWNSSKESMMIDGTPSKVVIDVWNKKEDSDSATQYTAVTVVSELQVYKLDKNKLTELEDEATTGNLVKSKKKRHISEDDDEALAALFQNVKRVDVEKLPEMIQIALRLEAPYHPYVKIFSLDSHDYYNIHINNLIEYKYDSSLIDKLILPEAHKDLVEILIDASTSKMKDIISGKSTGIIIVSTGPAGVGKTLTAEVFSEFVEKPLYKVQSSQLGADLKELEDTLKTVLRRASRWNAILLIDEADVYVYERGSNLQQNAIVGVFLRVLEYYKGILFMTSNRDTIIDDAILSRATAHLKYEYPSFTDLIEIWKVQNDLLNANLDPKIITDISHALPNVSGRDVRNILRLAKIIAQKKKRKITVEMIIQASKYQDLTLDADSKREDYRKSMKVGK